MEKKKKKNGIKKMEKKKKKIAGSAGSTPAQAFFAASHLYKLRNHDVYVSCIPTSATSYIMTQGGDKRIHQI